jgi:hypothetical protein
MLTTTEFVRVRAILKEPEPTLADIDGALASVEADIAEVRRIVDDLSGSHPAPTGREPWPDRSRREGVRADLTFLARGVTTCDGVTDPRVAARCGLPGLHRS